MRHLALLLLAPALFIAQSMPEGIDAILKSSATGQRGFWGIHVVSLGSGATLLALQPANLFVPASTAKLFTTALALERLGSGHRFVTSVAASRGPDAAGNVTGDLYLVGRGDPTLSARPVPYGKGAALGSPLRAIEELADQVVANGVRRVEGDVVGDDSAYSWEPHPEGRAQEDALWDYGAPVSALSINDNRFSLIVRPGRREGEPAGVRVSPSLEYFVIENRVRTSSTGEAKIEVERLPGSRQLRVWGSLPLKAAPVGLSLAVDDPAEYAATALYDALQRRGVAIGGKPIAQHRYAGDNPDRKDPDYELARRVSPPLREILEVIDKESPNLYAELVLREVARMRQGAGSQKAGLEEMRLFLREAGIPEEEARLADGSGLSTLNLVTPRAMTRLLAFMQSSKEREDWMGLLAAGGEDGTLSQRFTGVAAAGRIRAKTGTLSHVSALAGYARASGGDTRAFCIMVNNYASPASEIRAIIDRMVLLLIQ
jgi:serine-type D-Ala-D-Ala carboxypeptidase/endopeptidase (penicillin-binding protein 4)